MHASHPCLSLLGLIASGDIAGLTVYKSQQKKVVAFAKTRPSEAPTQAMDTHREKFALEAERWTNLTDEDKAKWVEITKKANLTMCGYQLFMHFRLEHDFTMLFTLQQQTGITVWPHNFRAPLKQRVPREPQPRKKRCIPVEASFDGGATTLYQNPNTTWKNTIFFGDLYQTDGIALTPLVTIDGPGTVTWEQIKNGRWSTWWLSVPNYDCVITVTFKIQDWTGAWRTLLFTIFVRAHP